MKQENLTRRLFIMPNVDVKIAPLVVLPWQTTVRIANSENPGDVRQIQNSAESGIFKDTNRSKSTVRQHLDLVHDLKPAQSSTSFAYNFYVIEYQFATVPVTQSKKSSSFDTHPHRTFRTNRQRRSTLPRSRNTFLFAFVLQQHIVEGLREGSVHKIDIQHGLWTEQGRGSGNDRNKTNDRYV